MNDEKESNIAGRRVEIDIDVWIFHASNFLITKNLMRHSGLERRTQLKKMLLSIFFLDYSDYT